MYTAAYKTYLPYLHRTVNLFILTDVDQFLGRAKATLGSLLERFTAAEIIEKLGSSILTTVFRQLVKEFFFQISNHPV